MPPESSCQAAGYAALIEHFGIQGIAPWHQSSVCNGAAKWIDRSASGIVETYPAQYWPGDDPCDHLEFALKYDGTDLALLAKILPAIGAESVARWVQDTPQGKYTRRIWYLFELLTGQRLPLADMTAGNYVDLLERDEYFVLDTPTQVRRQRVNDNLLGNGDFCPVVRRTAAITAFIGRDLSARSREIMSGHPPELLKRAMGYLYTKETKSSFEIEHIKPDALRTERFVALLHLATHDDLCETQRLVEALFAFIEQTVETELVEELSFLASYDRTKRAMQEVVDLPDRDLDLFVRVCLQNQGKLSEAKRDSTFRALKDDEVAQLERCVSDGYGSAGSGDSGKR